MELYLIRHAKSAHDWEKWPTDAMRPLSEKGRKRQKKTSVGMKKLGIEVDEAWVSPYKRAQETYEIIRSVCDFNIPKTTKEILIVSGYPNLVKDEIVQEFLRNPNKRLMLVGHNPNMSSVVRLLTKEYIDLKTSEMVHIGYDGEDFQLKMYYPRSELIKK